MNDQKVLILGGGLQAISTARSLKEEGYKVGMYINHKDYSTKSGALEFCVIEEGEYEIDNIIRIILKYCINAIIPMSDYLALFLSKHKEFLYTMTFCRICVPDYNAIKTASDKLQLMKLCSIHSFPHPYTLDDMDINDKIMEILPYPVLIKPNHSVGARGIVIAHNPSELKNGLISVHESFGRCHIQEYIKTDRPYYNVMIYRDAKGEILGYTILEILRHYPLSGGSSCLCRTIENKCLIQLCLSVLDQLNYIGFADFDILQSTDGEYKIIEINPRVPASLRAAAISGINFPDIIVRDSLGIPVKSQEYKPGIFLRYLGLDIMWFLKSPLRFKTKPSWFTFYRKNLYYQEGGWNDWKPMITSLWSNIKKTITIEIKRKLNEYTKL